MEAETTAPSACFTNVFSTFEPADIVVTSASVVTD